MISNGGSCSNAQGVSAANGCARFDPTDVRDAMEAGIFRFLAPLQAR